MAKGYSFAIFKRLESSRAVLSSTTPMRFYTRKVLSFSFAIIIPQTSNYLVSTEIDSAETAPDDASTTQVASESDAQDRYTPVDLPSPAERPDADVVIYDGNCIFCEKQVRNLLWFDGGQRLSFMSLHDPEVTRRYPELSYDQMMDQMYVVDSAGNYHGGAAAISISFSTTAKVVDCCSIDAHTFHSANPAVVLQPSRQAALQNLW